MDMDKQKLAVLLGCCRETIGAAQEVLRTPDWALSRPSVRDRIVKLDEAIIRLRVAIGELEASRS